jgi:hypothetical protein
MRTFAEPAGSPARWWSLVLRAYLCLFLIGCAAHRPPTQQIRSMETRLMLGEHRTVYHACINALQDLGYAVDVSDAEAGVLTASRATHEQSGVITEEPRDPDKKGLPTWATVVLICTGVILIVALVAVIASSHDDEDKDKDTKDTKQTKDKEVRRHERKEERRHHEEPPPPTYVVSPDEVAPTTYQYRITIHLQRKGGDATQTRVSLQGSELHGDQVMRSGPVDDPRFFERFFTALDDALRLEQQEQGSH